MKRCVTLLVSYIIINFVPNKTSGNGEHFTGEQIGTGLDQFPLLLQ